MLIKFRQHSFEVCFVEVSSYDVRAVWIDTLVVIDDVRKQSEGSFNASVGWYIHCGDDNS